MNYHKVFKETEVATLPNSFCKATINPMPKPDKDITRKQ